ncbi:hypothetical protein EVAR_34036_1 [Eumeta japonica]|uniref:Uncharacterized protein n=1 Tax=Eumeta variegata TaxID=151549 RepID=A0A4C1VSD3_EUMVA|nr:hypothetical protein EVAR_34036_1 [Eumeta japonica]
MPCFRRSVYEGREVGAGKGALGVKGKAASLRVDERSRDTARVRQHSVKIHNLSPESPQAQNTSSISRFLSQVKTLAPCLEGYAIRYRIDNKDCRHHPTPFWVKAQDPGASCCNEKS